MQDPSKCKKYLASIDYLKRQRALATMSKDGIDYVKQNVHCIAITSTSEAKKLSMERNHLAHDLHSDEVRFKKEEAEIY